ncbi:hypothetical protein, conserved [Trypanosoma brucei gambiense DAL972]|uniref:Transmembrane protein n=2 Tax=Trypanosoma brucei TaxID=5691 RepID=C9ZL34_TRYB9|nr:hypothetical protein, conserved [Trypanosoma brucei gambiense DAL972]RHW73753.1 hypothetical protein DPX39_030035200 [Trypanosoma brucei equiperdum]CBH10043.1 hypothetical protein, conserved [Trypanosoma brucei gambiense DAL972]|eukprot:XP_011772333.1 hypothetical protein, conserved [Trypanosoma brucei gambiense DAL972]
MATSNGFESPRESVAAAAACSSQLREAAERARKDPSKDIGLTTEELQERKRCAAEPHRFVSKSTSRPFEVKSSSRAQQIMTKGVVERQVTARQKEVLRKVSSLRKLQVGLFFVGVGFAYWVGVEFLLPHYAAVQERNRILRLRYEMAQRKREEHLRVQGSSQ